MAARKSSVDTVNADEIPLTPEEQALLTTHPDDWEFDVVVDESPTRIEFERFGDTFVGQYLGVMHIIPENGKDEPFDLLTFRGRDGGLYAVNVSYKLTRALADEHIGKWVKLEYVKDIDTDRGNPMKDFRVSVRKD